MHEIQGLKIIQNLKKSGKSSRYLLFLLISFKGMKVKTNKKQYEINQTKSIEIFCSSLANIQDGWPGINKMDANQIIIVA